MLQQFLKIFFILLVYVYECFVYLHVWVTHVLLVCPRRPKTLGCHITWNWSYIQMAVGCHVDLGIQPAFSVYRHVYVFRADYLGPEAHLWRRLIVPPSAAT